jgi:hypothetical protein
MSSPSKTTRPASGGISPETQLKSVVFPRPVGPDQARDGAGAHAEVRAGQGLDAVEGATKTGHVEQRGHVI